MKKQKGSVSIIIIISFLVLCILLAFFIIKNSKESTYPVSDSFVNTDVAVDKSKKEDSTSIERNENDLIADHELSIPISWETYDKDFAGNHFYFRYPKEFDIVDADEHSGDIYVGGTNSGISINEMLVIWPQFKPYKYGSTRVWFLENLPSIYGDLDYSEMSFKEIYFSNGNRYLKVSGWPSTDYMKSSIFSGDLYFGIQGDKVVYFHVRSALPEDDVMRILSSLEVE